MKYPILLYPDKIKHSLFGKVYPSIITYPEPKEPKYDRFTEEKAQSFFTGLFGLSLLGTILLIIALFTGDDNVNGFLFVTFLISSIFCGRIVHNLDEKEKRIKSENEEKEKLYNNELIAYKIKEKEYNRIISISKDPQKDLEFRKELVLDYLKHTQNNRNNRILRFDKPEQSISENINNSRQKVQNLFWHYSKYLRIKKNGSAAYNPLIYLNLVTEGGYVVLVDVDIKPFFHSTSDYSALYSFGLDYDNYFDEDYERHVLKKSFKELQELYSEIVKDGFIIVRFTQLQFQDYERCVATILNIMIFLKILSEKEIRSSFLYRDIDISAGFDFQEGIITY
jgi:hypothetical protein